MWCWFLERHQLMLKRKKIIGMLMQSYLTIVKAKSSSEGILALIDCLEVQEHQTRVDDDWKVFSLLIFCAA